jgi:Fur family ferric uptake transcriptional regulator
VADLAPPHSTADAIADGVREQFGALALQAIYGVLAAYTDAGLLRRIEPVGHPAQFESAGSSTAGTHYREEEWQ